MNVGTDIDLEFVVISANSRYIVSLRPHWGLLVNHSTRNANKKTKDPFGFRMLIPNQSIQDNSQTLVDHCSSRNDLITYCSFKNATKASCYQTSENEKITTNIAHKAATKLILTTNQSETRSRDKTSTPPATVAYACSNKTPHE
jgi:hypothetical protein